MIAPSRRLDALRRLKKAAPWLIATLAATVVNPWGWRIYAAIERQGSIVQTHSMWIWEWQGLRLTPAALRKALAWRDPDSAVYWLIFAASIAVLCALVERRFVPALLLASAIYLVIHAIRMEACFATITVVLEERFCRKLYVQFIREELRHGLKTSGRSKALAAIVPVGVIACFVGCEEL